MSTVRVEIPVSDILKLLVEVSNDIHNDAQREVSDPAFAGRTHGKRATFAAGCKGPMCMKANRDRARKQYRDTNPQASRARPGSRTAMEDLLLNNLIAEHIKEREEVR